jgi:hypothetical protein
MAELGVVLETAAEIRLRQCRKEGKHEYFRSQKELRSMDCVALSLVLDCIGCTPLIYVIMSRKTDFKTPTRQCGLN